MKIILWGGTGQAKVVRPIIEYWGSRVVAVFDDTPHLFPPFPDVPLYCGWSGFLDWSQTFPDDPTQIGFCVAIGNPHGRVRLYYHDSLTDAGLQATTWIHASAQVAPNASIGAGCQLMAGAVINPEAVIGRQCIINTKASIDHECVLEDGVEVGPGATVCGQVHLETNVWIGAGATVLPKLTIGHDSIVGAGAVVIRDIPPNVTVVGVPANRILVR